MNGATCVVIKCGLVCINQSYKNWGWGRRAYFTVLISGPPSNKQKQETEGDRMSIHCIFTIWVRFLI